MTRITHFMRHPRPNVFSIERLYEDVRGAMPEDCQVSVWTCRHPSTGLWPRLKDIWAARKAQGDVNHVTGDVHYLTYLLDSRKTVLTVHDLVLLGRLRGLQRWLVWLLWYWLPVKRSRAVVTISEATRSALLASVRCDPAKVHVIHNPVSDEFQPTPHCFNAKKPRILQIGTGWNKNLERVAEALEGISCQLVVIGSLSDKQVEALHHYKIDYENHVGLSREALVAQYVDADILIFVSTFEGFGLPIVEAQAVGRPVITSALSPMPEVAGEGACLADPFDVASIRAAVLEVIEDENYRIGLAESGLRNVEQFRTHAVGEKYAELYRKIAEKSGRRYL
ncbi:glycosyltransferase family 4 protein [Aquamicrobium segne]|uniref:Glycosyltransferase family 4 protein n=1 Tax=Aquamicrobium segne TaxID=469547 RepID=A0ABW0GXS7_9HYPH